MKYLKLFEGVIPRSTFLTPEQINWCNEHIKGRWGVNSAGEVTVPEELKILNAPSQFEVQFANVKGYFDCSENPNLVSLKGSPREVARNFYCSSCRNLTSLEGGPQKVGGSFNCSYNHLTSLEGAPREVRGSFYCGYNHLTSLEGAPREVRGSFYCGYNPLTSLEGAPDIISDLFILPIGEYRKSTIEIEWNMEGFLDGFEMKPDLFLPFLDAEHISNWANENIAKFSLICDVLDPEILSEVLNRLGMTSEDIESIRLVSDMGLDM